MVVLIAIWLRLKMFFFKKLELAINGDWRGSLKPSRNTYVETTLSYIIHNNHTITQFSLKKKYASICFYCFYFRLKINLIVQMRRKVKSTRKNCHPYYRKVTNKPERSTIQKYLRCEQGSNLRGKIPLDFKSNALTTRPSQHSGCCSSNIDFKTSYLPPALSPPC